MSRGEMLQVQMNIIETKQIYKPWLPFDQSKSSQEYEDKRRKEGFFTKVAIVLDDLKNCDIVVVLI